MDKDWSDRAARCSRAAEGFEPYHKFMPISTMVAGRSEIVTTIMCTICFHEINVSEAHKYRDGFKSE